MADRDEKARLPRTKRRKAPHFKKENAANLASIVVWRNVALMNENDKTRAAMDAFALGMFSEIAAHAEPLLAAKIQASGVDDFRKLGRDLAGAMLKDSLLEAAAAHFVGLDMVYFRRAVDAVFDPKWMDAFTRVRNSLESSRPAFDLAVGPDAAIVLAGVGVAVVPLDKKTMRPIGEVTNDWREAEVRFGKLKSAFVGYDTTQAPFYALVTDCLSSMNVLVQNDPRMAHARQAVVRTGYEFRPASKAFQHSTLLVPRGREDKFEVVVLEDPRDDRGSVMFLAGWRDEDGEPAGAPNDGFFGMPLQVLHAILHNPAFLSWMQPDDDAKPMSMH